MKQYRFFFLVLCGLCLGLPCGLMAQMPLFKQHPLSIAAPTAVYQLKNGYLCVGGSTGIGYYNGVNWVYRRTDTAVSALFEDATQRLWVGLENGRIGHYTDGQWRDWLPEEGAPQAKITAIAADPYNRIWIATYGEGLYCWTGQRLFNFNTDDGLPSNDLYAMAIQPDGTVWVGTDAGVSACRFYKEQKNVQNFGLTEGVGDLIVKALATDKIGRLYAGCYNGSISLFDPNAQRFTPLANLPQPDVISALWIDPTFKAWVGTEGQGLTKITPDGQTNLRDNVAYVKGLCPDDEGNLWIIGDRQGLVSAFLPLELQKIGPSTIQSLFLPHPKTAFVGTQQGLWTYQLPYWKQPQTAIANINVLSQWQLPNGAHFVGTYGQGLWWKAPGQGRWQRLAEAQGLSNLNIFSMTGHNDTLWLATLGGVFQVTFEKNKAFFRNYNTKSGLLSDFIYCAHEDRQHRIWFGTDGKGVSMLQNGVFHNFTHADNRPMGAIIGLTQDHNGRIWAANVSGLLFYFDQNNFHTAPTVLGDNVAGLTHDGQGHLVALSSHRFLLYQTQAGTTFDLTTFTGLSAIESGLNVFATAPEGALWTAASGHILRLRTLGPLRRQPLTRLTAVKVFMSPIDTRTDTLLDHDRNYLSLDFEGLWLSQASAVHFRYKMEGIDPDWKTTTMPQAVYPNLPPGTYTFRVQSALGTDFTQAHEAVFRFKIAPPIWMRWWFVAGSVLLLAGIVYLVLKTQEKRLAKEADLKREKVEAQLDMLKSQINPHFLFNSFNTLAAIIEENPQMAVEYVEKLADFYRSILQYREKNVITVAEELALLDNFIFLLYQRHGAALSVHIDLAAVTETFIVPLSLQLLVENAIKHNVVSKARPLSIRLFSTDAAIVVENQIQQKKAEGGSTQFGLQSLQSRYQLLTDKKVIVTASEHYFRVAIPILLTPKGH